VRNFSGCLALRATNVVVDLEQYYASLAASAAPTPLSRSVSTPRDDEGSDQMSSRKRSRSFEDDGGDARKHGRFDGAGVNGEANGDDLVVYGKF
jgi:hypothetical protein